MSYLDDKLVPVGFSIELCKHVVGAVEAQLGTCAPMRNGPPTSKLLDKSYPSDGYALMIRRDDPQSKRWSTGRSRS